MKKWIENKQIQLVLLALLLLLIFLCPLLPDLDLEPQADPQPLGRHQDTVAPVYQVRRGVEMEIGMKDVKEKDDRMKLNVILILCGGSHHKSNEYGRTESSRQIRQANVLLKSAVLLTKRKLHVHVLTDSSQVYKGMVNRTANWSASFPKKITFSMHEVWYPEGYQNMRNDFKPCATDLLFVPDIFPALDRAIYLDTDTILMRPPEDLWAFFDSFSPSHVAAMAPNVNNNYGTIRKTPFYGDTGLNSAVMLMDLNRMRSLPKGWTGEILAIEDKYRSRFKGADQDRFNVLFRDSPEKLFELPCEWNYRKSLCQEGKNLCPEKKAVSLLHGNGQAFVSGKNMKMQAIFEGFENHKLGEESLTQLHLKLRTALTKIDNMHIKNVWCRPGINPILLGNLKKQAAIRS